MVNDYWNQLCSWPGSWQNDGKWAVRRAEKDQALISNFPSYFICKLIIRQFERSAHPWNVFQHSKRNFVSLHGHVISSIYSSSKYRTEAQSDLKISGSNSGLISWNSRNKPKSHELTRPILSRYWYIISRQITVAQSANPSTQSLLCSEGSHRWVGSSPGQAKIVILCHSNKLKSRSDLEISRTNSAFTSSNTRKNRKPTDFACPILPKKVNFDTFLSVPNPLLRAPPK